MTESTGNLRINKPSHLSLLSSSAPEVGAKRATTFAEGAIKDVNSTSTPTLAQDLAPKVEADPCCFSQFMHKLCEAVSNFVCYVIFPQSTLKSFLDDENLASRFQQLEKMINYRANNGWSPLDFNFELNATGKTFLDQIILDVIDSRGNKDNVKILNLVINDNGGKIKNHLMNNGGYSFPQQAMQNFLHNPW